MSASAAGGAERGRLGGEHLPRLVEQRRLVDDGDVAVFGDHPPRHHGQHHITAVLAVHQLFPQVVERGEGDGVQVDHGQIGEHARGDHPEVVAPGGAGTAAPERFKISAGVGHSSLSSPEMLWIRPGGLGDGPDVDGVVADSLVGAERDRDAVVKQGPPGCHPAAEPQIADRVVHDR